MRQEALMSDNSLDFVDAGVPPTRTVGRWPTIVCDGWITPNHPRRVLRAGDPWAGISFGMCPICAAALIATAERARRRRWRHPKRGGRGGTRA